MAVTANPTIVYREEKGPLGDEAYNLTPQEVDGNFKQLDTRLATVENSEPGGEVTQPTGPSQYKGSNAANELGYWPLPVNGSSSPYELFVEDFGAVGDGLTDDTSAIQAALNAAHALGSADVILQPVKYRIAGALNTANGNCQLYIPLTRYGLDNGAHIRLICKTKPNLLFNFAGGVSEGSGGAILISDITGTGTLPAVFGTPTYTSTIGSFNHTYFSMENVIIRTKTFNGSTHVPGTMSGINFENMSNFQYDNISIEITSNFDSMAAPMNETYGIIFPKQLNFAYTIGGTARVLGYRYGIVPSEHLNAKQFFLAFLHAGLYIKNPGQHGVVIDNLSVESTKFNILHAAEMPVYVTTAHFEHHPSTANWYGFEQDVQVENTGLNRKIFFGHVNLGTWGSLGQVEYNFKTNSPKHVAFRYLNARDVESDAAELVVGASSMDALLARRYKVNLTANATFNLVNGWDGAEIRLLAFQDATGGRTLTINGAAISVTTTANAVDLVVGTYDTGNWYFRNYAATQSGSGTGTNDPFFPPHSAYYSFEEETGNILDTSGNGFNLTRNSASGQPLPATIVGKVGKAVELVHSAGQYLYASQASNLHSAGDNGLAVAFWVNIIAETGIDQQIISKWGSVEKEWVIGYNIGSINITVSQNGTSTFFGVDRQLVPGNADIYNQWFFVVCEYNPATGKLLISVNNSAPNMADCPGIIKNTAAPLYMGRSEAQGSSYQANVRIDEVLITQRVLTESEKVYLYNGGAGRTKA